MAQQADTVSILICSTRLSELGALAAICLGRGLTSAEISWIKLAYLAGRADSEEHIGSVYLSCDGDTGDTDNTGQEDSA